MRMILSPAKNMKMPEICTYQLSLAVQAFMDFKAYKPYVQAETLSLEDMAFAEEHLRILSGFYGVLKPLDAIMPYRLEMMCKIKIDDMSLYRSYLMNENLCL